MKMENGCLLMTMVGQLVDLVSIQAIADFERSVPLEAATSRIAQLACNLAEERKITFHCYEKKGIHIVYVEDAQLHELAYGLGKGAHSQIGAYGECIEHLMYQRIGVDGCTPISTDDFITSQELRNDVVLRYAFDLPTKPVTVSCIPFTPINSTNTLFLPSLFFNYHLIEEPSLAGIPFYKFMSRYVTTSGTAFGLTANDAFLHALNELIERDLTSEFFLQMSACDYPTKNVFYALDVSTLPPYLETVAAEIGKISSSSDIAIYTSQSIFGNWWCLCVVRPSPDSCYVLPQWGAGCSLLYDLAIYRCLTECLQMLIAYEHENQENDMRLLEFIQCYPQFEGIAHFAVSGKIKEERYDSRHNCDQMTVDSQLEMICRNMISTGFQPAKHIFPSTNGFSVVTAYVPNLERFYNITKCVPVLPLSYIKSRTNQWVNT